MNNDPAPSLKSPPDDVDLAPTLTNPATLPTTMATASIALCLRPPEDVGELGRIAHFKVTRLLGQGGMGMVLEGIDLSLNRPVALKVIHPDAQADAAARERFLNEARACAALRHDHIVPIYQVGEDGQTIFLAMPLLHGLPLDRWLQTQPRPHLMQILRIGREVAEGLAAAHAAGIIHRDIKLANIWLEAPRGRVIILDFGLAGHVSNAPSPNSKPLCVGTPGYLAPEQARGIVCDHRGDLFSLGVVLYRLCTGKMPFPPAESTLDYFTTFTRQSPQPPIELNKNVPPQLNDLIISMLSIDPMARPESARVVRQVLQQIQEDQFKLCIEEGHSPQILQRLAVIPIEDPTAFSDSPLAPGSQTTSLTSFFVPPPRRRKSMSILALALLLGSMMAMGLWIYERPSESARPTLTSSAMQHIKRINAREMVKRIGLVRAPLVAEASALIKSRKHPGIYWTLCDSHNPPYLFAIELTGKLRATICLEGVDNIDWEALALDQEGHIYVGDIGNNYFRHKKRHIYRIDEPDRLDNAPAHQPVNVPVTGKWHFTYPGKAFDAETLIIQDDTFWIISKSQKLAETRLYRLPMKSEDTTHTLEEVGRLPPEMLAIADGSMAPDGKRIALVNKYYTVLYSLPNGKVSDILSSEPIYYEYDLNKVEGCAWDGDDLILIAEDRKIYRLPLPR